MFALEFFHKIVEQFDKKGVSFVSVTPQFNTTSSMDRLTLNVLFSFAQFEREVLQNTLIIFSLYKNNRRLIKNIRKRMSTKIGKTPSETLERLKAMKPA